jgi:hypothetical protein
MTRALMVAVARRPVWGGNLPWSRTSARPGRRIRPRDVAFRTVIDPLWTYGTSRTVAARRVQAAGQGSLPRAPDGCDSSGD